MFEIGNPSKLRHGHARRGQQTPEHVAWQAMKRRCIDPKSAKFKHYGGRGIKVCERWMNSFENFLADVGPRPSPEHSIDRYPNRNGNYEPGNVRWATRRQQINNRDCARLIPVDGMLLSISEACERLGLSQNVVGHRLSIGWSVDDALTIPVKRRKRAA